MNLSYLPLALLCSLATLSQVTLIRSYKVMNPNSDPDLVEAMRRLKAGSWLILTYGAFTLVFRSYAVMMPVYVCVSLGLLAFTDILAAVTRIFKLHHLDAKTVLKEVSSFGTAASSTSFKSERE